MARRFIPRLKEDDADFLRIVQEEEEEEEEEKKKEKEMERKEPEEPAAN